jgi:hypothetical protein
MAQNASAFKDVAAVHHAVGQSQALAAMPRLIPEAADRRNTSSTDCTAALRWPARTGNTAVHVSELAAWTGAARHATSLYVREQEWCRNTVWIWPDRSPSMIFRRRWPGRRTAP